MKKRVLLVQLPPERYLERGIPYLQTHITKNRHPLYISFQRPEANLKEHFTRNNIDNIEIIDLASELATAPPENIDLDNIITTIYKASLKHKELVVFIDSLSTILLYKPLSELLRLSEVLIRLAKQKQKILLLLGIASDFASKEFVKNIALLADDIVTPNP
ncbi:hypothetical protein D6783_03165 [Candidatus Woesearchaeota archaeon]|nr:MAG: hypothetical protein D6783_03165 [Candidatus Woesearchaeota archaeon]